jgi:hypothetical protein
VVVHGRAPDLDAGFTQRREHARRDVTVEEGAGDLPAEPSIRPHDLRKERGEAFAARAHGVERGAHGLRRGAAAAMLDARRDGAEPAHGDRAPPEPLAEREHARHRDESAAVEDAVVAIEAARALPPFPWRAVWVVHVERFALERPHLIQIALAERALVERHDRARLARGSASALRSPYGS